MLADMWPLCTNGDTCSCTWSRLTRIVPQHWSCLGLRQDVQIGYTELKTDLPAAVRLLLLLLLLLYHSSPAACYCMTDSSHIDVTTTQACLCFSGM